MNLCLNHLILSQKMMFALDSAVYFEEVYLKTKQSTTSKIFVVGRRVGGLHTKFILQSAHAKYLTTANLKWVTHL